MAAIAGVGAHLLRPAAGIDRIAPGGAGQDFRGFQGVEGVVLGFALHDDFTGFPAHTDDQFLGLKAGYGQDAGDLGQQGAMLGVIDFVEPGFLRRLHIHTGDKQVTGRDGHCYTSGLIFAAIFCRRGKGAKGRVDDPP